MRIIALILLVGLLVPQVSFAAWWKPASWKIFNRSNKTQELEGKIKELENKLNEVASSTNGYPIKQNKTQTPLIEKKVVPAKNLPTVEVIPPAVVQKDYESIYKELRVDYSALMSDVADMYGKLQSKSSLTDLERSQKKFFNELFTIISKDLKELKKYEGKETASKDVIDSYISKYNQHLADLKLKVATYEAKKEKAEKAQEALRNEEYKKQVIDFIRLNKTRLYQTSMHVETALMLDVFDRTFSTKYADKFKLTKTQQETIEFSNSFLLDMGVSASQL